MNDITGDSQRSMQGRIYGLYDRADPDKVIRYIGVTSQDVLKRKADHESEARFIMKHRRRPNAKQQWVWEVLQSGSHLGVELLMSGDLHVMQHEEHNVMKQYDNLTNKPNAAGGKFPGTKDSAETRQKKSDAWQENYAERSAIMGVAMRRIWREDRGRMIHSTVGLHRPESIKKAGKTRSRQNYEQRVALCYPVPEEFADSDANWDHNQAILALKKACGIPWRKRHNVDVRV